VHRDQHVRLTARRQDVARREVDLERGDPGQGPGGGADLGREVRERREIVADQGGRRSEPVAGELYPVARVAGKSDDDALFLFRGLRHAIGATAPAALVATAP